MKKLVSIVLTALMLCGAGAVGAGALTMEEPWGLSPDLNWHEDAFTAPEDGWYSFYSQDPLAVEASLYIVNPLTNSTYVTANSRNFVAKKGPSVYRVHSNTAAIVLPFYLQEGQEVKLTAMHPKANGEAVIAVRNYDIAVDYAGLEFQDLSIPLLRNKRYSLEDCVSGAIPGTVVAIEYEDNGVLEVSGNYVSFTAVPRETGACTFTFYDAAGDFLGQSAVTVKSASLWERLGWISLHIAQFLISIVGAVINYSFAIPFFIFLLIVYGF